MGGRGRDERDGGGEIGGKGRQLKDKGRGWDGGRV